MFLYWQFPTCIIEEQLISTTMYYYTENTVGVLSLISGIHCSQPWFLLSSGEPQWTEGICNGKYCTYMYIIISNEEMSHIAV